MKKCSFIVTIFCTIFCIAPINSSSKEVKKELNSSVKQLNGNRIRNWLSNNGEIVTFQDNSNGLTWPDDNGNLIIYSSGLWVAGKVKNTIRSAMVYYDNTELQPGKIINGYPDSPYLDKYRVYLIDSNNKFSTDYLNWPSNDGAPTNFLGDPLIYGAQAAWFVCNDAEEYNHIGNGFKTPPLGIEEQTYIYCFNNEGVFKDMMVVEYTLINKSSENIDSTYIGFWSDPDLGNSGDDFVGYDSDLSMGYAWNNGEDYLFGKNPPAVGYLPLKYPVNQGKEKGITSFVRFYYQAYIDVGGPGAIEKAYFSLKGLSLNGQPFIDPTTGLKTKYMFSGNPVTGKGWIDHTSGDRSFLMSSGPFSFTAGDTQKVAFAIVIAQGVDNLTSISSLKNKAINIRNLLSDSFAVDIFADDDIVRLNQVVTLSLSSVWLKNKQEISDYSWALISAPPGSAIKLNSTKTAVTTFSPDVVGEYKISATLTLSNGIKRTCFTNVCAVSNRAPVAEMEISQHNIIWGDSVLVDLTKSYDPDNDSLVFRWNVDFSNIHLFNENKQAIITPLYSGTAHVSVTVRDELNSIIIEDSVKIAPKIKNIKVEYNYVDSLLDSYYLRPYFHGDTLLAPNSIKGVMRVYDIQENNIVPIKDIQVPNVEKICGLMDGKLYILISTGLSGLSGPGSLTVFSIGKDWQLIPVLEGYLPDEYDIYDMVFQDQFIFMRDLRSVYKIDFSNISNPQIVTRRNYEYPKYPGSMLDVGDYIYTRIDGYPNYTFEVLDKNSLNYIKTLDLPNKINSISVHDTLLFAGSSKVDSLFIYSLSDPLNPYLVVHISVPPPDFLPIRDQKKNSYTAKYLNNSLIAVNVGEGIEIFNIENISSPESVASWYCNDRYLHLEYHDDSYYLIKDPLHNIPKDDYIGITKIRLTTAPDYISDRSKFPLSFKIYQNFPNPFNPITTINYTVPVNGHVEIAIYNSLGQKVNTLVNGYKLAGSHSVVWNASDVGSGIYFYRLQAGEYSIVKKCIIIK